MSTPDPPQPIRLWLDRLSAAQPDEHDRRLLNLEAQQTTNTVALAALVQMIHDLKESQVATAEEFAARLDSASTAIGARITDLTAQVKAVVDLIPAERQAAVNEALASLDDEAARLEAWGKDAENPVPNPEPAPVDPTPTPDEPAPGDGGTDVVNPTVDSDGNPIV